LGSIWKSFSKSADEVLLSGQKDVDDFFEHERNYLVEYHNNIKEGTNKADRMTRVHKNLADLHIKIATTIEQWATIEKPDFDKFLMKLADTFEKARKLEGRISTDTDLKLSDMLRYYMRDTEAAKDLLYRRIRCLANYESANKNLERARAKNKDVLAAELTQQAACERFEKITDVAKQELKDLKLRRVQAFKKSLTDLAELQIKHAKAYQHLLKSSTAALKEGNYAT